MYTLYSTRCNVYSLILLQYVYSILLQDELYALMICPVVQWLHWGLLVTLRTLSLDCTVGVKVVKP